MFGAKKTQQIAGSADVSAGQKGKKEKESKKRLIIVVLAAVVVIAAAGAAYCYFTGIVPQFLAGRQEAGEKEIKTKAANLGDIVVNLSDFGGNRYLRISIVFEFGENAGLEKEIDEKQYKIRDALIDLLRRKTSGDIQAPENIEALKGQILLRANEQLNSGKIDSVYFTDFLFQ